MAITDNHRETLYAENDVTGQPAALTTSTVNGTESLNVYSIGGSSTSYNSDIFGYQVIVQPYNQIELRGDDSDWASFVAETNANGGDTAQSSGLLNITTSTAATGSAILASVDQVRYRPGVGVYGAGTMIFTTGTAGANQYFGLGTDTSFANGLAFGYKGTSFGIRYTRGGAEVSFIAQADWDDPCLGASTSSFTRGGTAEALDPLKDNLYRFEAGLFGFAGWRAQVWSPDNGWITVYTYEHINTGTVPVFTSNNFKMVASAVKTSGATNITMKTQCWAAGTGTALMRLGSADLSDRTLSQTVRSVLAAKKPNGSYTNIDATAGGNLKVSLEEVEANVVVPSSQGPRTLLYSTTTPLAGNGNVVSSWLDLTDYTGIEAIVYTTHDSATSGAKLLFSGDGGTTTHRTLANTLTGGLGAYPYRIPKLGYNALKIDYTNGATLQTGFAIYIYGITDADPTPIAPMGSGIDPTISANLTRAVIAAQNPSGSMSNLVTSASGYLQNSIAEVQVDLPIKAGTTLDITQVGLSTTASQLTATATNRKTVSLKAPTANAANIYIGTSNAVSTGNGYELAAGDAVEFDLTEGQALYAIAASGTPRVCIAELS